MGVPSFYRWLVDKYPDVVVQARETTQGEDGVDTSKPNPNGMEFDNLYLDMNGIIHPCFHPEEDTDPPSTFEQVFQNIFEYIDQLFKIVRPRKLLFMAIDGVAPRAKMNQQRARRFRTAKDAETAEFEEEKLRKDFERQGKNVLPKLESELSDSNVITPGTDFMDKLSKALEEYIFSRLNSDPGWKNIKVILSDANVPGEGEHKIMKLIRLQRTQTSYDPNTRHCLYGLDADLIMLALATHELHFSILREDVLVEDKRPSLIRPFQKCLSEHNSGFLTSSGGCSSKWEAKSILRKPCQKPYQFLNIWTLREYLELDLKISEPPSDINFERIVDDFIFICFFTGNDFLPHLPSLEIRELGIDLLMAVYKDEFKSRGGYLVDTERLQDKKAGYVKLKRIEKFILSVGTYEEKIFKKRMDLRQRMIKKLYQQMANDIEPEEPFIQPSTSDLDLNGRNDYWKGHTVNVATSKSDSGSSAVDVVNEDDVHRNAEEINRKVKNIMREKSDLFKQGGLESDRIRLGMQGWKERYYKEKFAAESSEDIENIRKGIVEKYTEGLCWVLQYYFFGVKSWTWFYPYHYGPFASDLKGLGRVNISFNMGIPFKPFEQLMGVLPPRSCCALPNVYWPLMTSDESKLIDFYPTDFDVDIDGKRHLWQGVVKLPFIDEKKLLMETKKLEMELKENEARRNSQGMEKIFALSSHGLGSQIASLYTKNVHSKPEMKMRVTIDPCASDGMNGFISLCRDDPGSANCTSCEKEMEDTLRDDVVCATYECPDIRPHIPRLLENILIPEKKIMETDIVTRQLWHVYDGHRPTNNRCIQERYRKELNAGKSASSDVIPGKEVFKLAGSGWSAGRGKANVDASRSPNCDYSRDPAPYNIHPAQSGSSLQTGAWSSGRGRALESFNNRILESSRQIQSSLAKGTCYAQPTRKQTSASLRPRQAASSSTLATGKWVPSRGHGLGDSSSNPPSNCYNANKQVSTGKTTPSSVGRGWAGSGQGWGRGNGSFTPSNSNTQVNVGKITPSSVGPGSAGAGPGPSQGRGRGNVSFSGLGIGSPGGAWRANNSFWPSKNGPKNYNSSWWRNDASSYAQGS